MLTFFKNSYEVSPFFFWHFDCFPAFLRRYWAIFPRRYIPILIFTMILQPESGHIPTMKILTFLERSCPPPYLCKHSPHVPGGGVPTLLWAVDPMVSRPPPLFTRRVSLQGSWPPPSSSPSWFCGLLSFCLLLCTRTGRSHWFTDHPGPLASGLGCLFRCSSWYPCLSYYS